MKDEKEMLFGIEKKEQEKEKQNLRFLLFSLDFCQGLYLLG